MIAPASEKQGDRSVIGEIEDGVGKCSKVLEEMGKVMFGSVLK